MRSSIFSKGLGAALLAVGISPSLFLCSAADDARRTKPDPTSPGSGLYVKVQLDHPVKLSKLKPASVLEGQLARDVYSADHELFPVGSRVQLTVDHVEKRKRDADDHWPWVVKIFTPRHRDYPIFTKATVFDAGGENNLQVSLVSISRRREIHAQATGKKSRKQAGEAGSVQTSKSGGIYGPGKLAAPILVLEAWNIDGTTSASNTAAAGQPADSSSVETLPAGTPCKILLLGEVSASKSKVGDLVRARLLEPVSLDSHIVLPAGSVFEGKVVKQTPPRWGSRSGSLYLTFTGLTLPDGNFMPVAASLVGAELDHGSHTRMDSEGRLRGERPGKAWMAINIGVTAGLAKEVDDATQLIVEALISTATDASTAGTARIVSSCISGIFMVSRHGRDVLLPRFTEMDISLDRPLTVTTKAAAVTSAAVVQGN